MATNNLSTIDQNAQVLEQELHWLTTVINHRLQIYYKDNVENSIYELEAPDLSEAQGTYAAIIKHYQCTLAERLLLLLALAPRLRPEILLPFTLETNGVLNPQFGRVINNNTQRVLPTRQTVHFLLGENQLGMIFRLGYLLQPEHFLFQHRILEFNINNGEQVLEVSEEYFTYLTTGEQYLPDYSMSFPAKRIETQLEWSELVLPPHVEAEISDIRNWIEHGNTLLQDWGLNRKLKSGYRALFHGKPGTGKTLTATLLGKATGRAVYRVDLSMTVSKYIGETEKNLKNLFDQAEDKAWILFFDEADALFSRRTESRSANDRHANQQVAYLLQRVEDYNGLVILASNLPHSLDEAFSRRFESVINFPMPNTEQRLRLWQNYFQSEAFTLEDSIDLKALAKKYEVAGGSIISLLKFCCIRAIGRGTNVLLQRDLMEGLRKVFAKEGRSV